MCQWPFPWEQEHTEIMNIAEEWPQRGEFSITLPGKQMGTIKATLPACLGCSQEDSGNSGSSSAEIFAAWSWRSGFSLLHPLGLKNGQGDKTWAFFCPFLPFYSTWPPDFWQPEGLLHVTQVSPAGAGFGSWVQERSLQLKSVNSSREQPQLAVPQSAHCLLLD